jgi:hypothetical protein
MVDTIEELSALSRKLNQSSDRINAVISGLNEKLANLNFGLEVWYETVPVEETDWETLDRSQVSVHPREKSLSYLGYCRFDDGWELALKSATLTEMWDSDAEEVTSELSSVVHRPLLKASREARAKAIRFIPRLLDEIKDEAQGLLRSIDEAEKVATKLNK